MHESHSSGELTSLTLLQRVRGRETAAWDRFVQLYEPVVRRWCERAGLQSSDASDLVQELFTTVFTKLDTFRHDHAGASFRGWLWTIAHNRVRLHFRKQATRPIPIGGDSALHSFEDSDANSDEPTPPPESLAEVVRRAMEMIQPEFEPTTWQAFWRVQVDNEAVGDVAKELSISPNAVYKSRARVLRRLRDEFGELID